jgi:hypothetical protein
MRRIIIGTRGKTAPFALALHIGKADFGGKVGEGDRVGKPASHLDRNGRDTVTL